MNQKSLYEELYQQLQALLQCEHDMIANMANCSALLYQTLPQINWAGFYRWHNGELILGPFQGKPACMHIPYGKGVCGTCVKEQRLLRIEDVHHFPGHIACDAASRSEIVLPLYQNGNLIGVLDIDAPIPSRFTQEDEDGLLQLVALLENSWNI